MAETAGVLKRPDGEGLAWLRVEGAGPTLFWLVGYRSDMAVTKAHALSDLASFAGRSFLLFDYF